MCSRFKEHFSLKIDFVKVRMKKKNNSFLAVYINCKKCEHPSHEIYIFSLTCTNTFFLLQAKWCKED